MTYVNCEYVSVSDQAAVRSNWRVKVERLDGTSTTHWGITAQAAYEDARRAYMADGETLVALVTSEIRRATWLQESGLVERR